MKRMSSISRRISVIAAITVAGTLAWSSAHASPEGGVPSAADETTQSMSTLRSLDRQTGGFQGFGPMANLQTPSASDESSAAEYFVELHEQTQHVAEVRSAGDAVWLANAPLRAPYALENIGATKAEAARGELRYSTPPSQ
jgi:hypothetical protein